MVRGDDLLASAPRNAAVIEALGGRPRLRASAPGPGSGLEASFEAARRHERGGVPRTGVPPGGVGELPGAPRMGKDDHTTFLDRDELVESFDLRTSRTTPRSSTRRSWSG